MSPERVKFTRLYAKGLNLKTWLSPLSESLDVAQIERLWTQILLAVRAVHKAGYIHGDLKLSNILFVGGVLKLIDFDNAAQILSGNSHVVRESDLETLQHVLYRGAGDHWNPNAVRVGDLVQLLDADKLGKCGA